VKIKGLLMIVVSALLLTGCTANHIVPIPSEQMGTIVLHLTKGEAVALEVLPEPTHVRIRISHSNGFNAIKDVPVAETHAVEIPVPAVDGYRVDAFSYVEGWLWQESSKKHDNLLLKHDVALGVNVSPRSATMVQLKLKPIAPEVTLPSEAVANEPFLVSITNVPDIIDFAQIVLSIEPIRANIGNWEGHYLGFWPRNSLMLGNSVRINAPDTDEEGHMYFQAVLRLHSDYMFDDEYSNFNFWINNISLGEPQISVPIRLPDGGIIIGIEY